MLSLDLKAMMMAQLLTPAFHAWGAERSVGSIAAARDMVDLIEANLATEKAPAQAPPADLAHHPQPPQQGSPPFVNPSNPG